MARHSKWHNIKHRKAAQDAKKGKVYSLHSKLISLAAQKGADPDKNASLFAAIAKAKADGVPNDNIDRAVKKWGGDMSGENQLQEIVYEGYGPGGVAIIVHTITDNKNRTASNMRHIFTKYGGDMGQTGSVSWIFKRKGVIIVDAEKYNYDTVESLVFETSAEDIELDGTTVSITTSPEDLLDITSTLQEKDIRPEMSELEYIAENDIEITDFEKVLKLTKMLEAFDEDEDVESVSSNEEISEELQTEVDEFIEKNTFRT